MNGQNSELEKSLDYKNMVKYLAQAQTYAAKGDQRNAQKRLNYAKSFSAKLIKKGYEKDIAKELQQISSLEKGESSTSSAAPKKTASTTGNSMSNSEFRKAVSQLGNMTKSINWLLNVHPAQTNLSTYKNENIEHFNRQAILTKIQTIRNSTPAQQAFNKRYLTTVDAAEKTINDLENAMKTANIYQKIDETMNKGKTENDQLHQMKFYFSNAMTYIKHLLKLTPNNGDLLSRQQTAKQGLAATKQKMAAQTQAKQQAKAQHDVPVAGMKDSRLESEFTRLAGSTLPNNIKITKAIITSSSWGVNRDALGRPIDRMMICAMIEKGSDGQCYVQHFVFKQLANGNTYGRTKMDNSYGNKRKAIDCSLVR